MILLYRQRCWVCWFVGSMMTSNLIVIIDFYIFGNVSERTDVFVDLGFTPLKGRTHPFVVERSDLDESWQKKIIMTISDNNKIHQQPPQSIIRLFLPYCIPVVHIHTTTPTRKEKTAL